MKGKAAHIHRGVVIAYYSLLLRFRMYKYDPNRPRTPNATNTPRPMLMPISLIFNCAGLGGKGVGVNGMGVMVLVIVAVGICVSAGAGVGVGTGVLVSIAE